jgi:hypothetical protein
MNLNKLLLTSTAGLGLLFSQFAAADSDLQFGGGATASASLDFRITIPQFVYFQVGSAAAVVDRVDWDLTGSQPGLGAPLGATGGTGDGVDGILSITLITNAATVTIASNTGGGNLVDGGNTIPFSEITVADGGNIAAPDFDTNTVIATGGVYSQTDSWTYTYDDSNNYAAGTYNGTSVYTAATP